MKKSLITCTTIALLTSATAFSQDKSKDKVKAPAKDKKETVASKDGKDKKKEKKADVELTIEGNDLLKFDKEAFKVKEGQTVKLTLKNVGKNPKAVMGHNLVILTKGTDLAAFALKAMTSPTTDYIPPDKATKAKIFAATKLLGPAESDSITFTAPAAGKYEYLCTFPGHYALMKGVMTVEAKGKGKGKENPAKGKDKAKTKEAAKTGKK